MCYHNNQQLNNVQLSTADNKVCSILVAQVDSGDEQLCARVLYTSASPLIQQNERKSLNKVPQFGEFAETKDENRGTLNDVHKLCHLTTGCEGRVLTRRHAGRHIDRPNAHTTKRQKHPTEAL